MKAKVAKLIARRRRRKFSGFLVPYAKEIEDFGGRPTRGMEHARCPACLQHPNETHGVAQPCPRGFAPVLTGAIWAAAAELLPAVRQLADRYNAQGTRRRFTGKERRRRCRRFTAARSRLSKLATPSMRTSRRSWTRETSPPLSYRGTVRAGRHRALPSTLAFISPTAGRECSLRHR